MRGKAFFAIAAVLAMSSAPAAASQCYRPAAPDTYVPPDIEYYEMQRLNSDIEAYRADMEDYVACLENAASAARYEADRVLGEWRRSGQSDNYQ